MQQLTIQGETLQLHPERGLWWPARRILMLADLHLGKGAHFRRYGIAVPTAVTDVNFSRLGRMVDELGAERVLFLGDLFHSEWNRVWPAFCDFLEEYPKVTFGLVPGNHDILPPEAYSSSCLELLPEEYPLGPFLLTHHPPGKNFLPARQGPNPYILCGHVHPCVKLVDRGGKGLKLPCFYFGEHYGILPAFGEFTGCAEVKAKEGDRVFVLAEGAVVRAA